MRNLAKTGLRMLSLLAVLPILVFDFALRRLGNDGVFKSCCDILSLVPGRIGSYLRLAYLRVAAPNAHASGYIGFNSLFSQRNTHLGRNIYIGPQCNIGSCRIGDDTLVASGVHVMSGTGQHQFDSVDTPIRDQGGKFVQVNIGSDCWIGNGAIVMADIGSHSVVGAGAVVTKALPPYSVAVGNPARVVRTRLDDTQDPGNA